MFSIRGLSDKMDDAWRQRWMGPRPTLPPRTKKQIDDEDEAYRRSIPWSGPKFAPRHDRPLISGSPEWAVRTYIIRNRGGLEALPFRPGPGSPPASWLQYWQQMLRLSAMSPESRATCTRELKWWHARKS